jgi:glutathione S-transferase
MILVGQYDSPYVRRVAVSLRVLGFVYDHDTRSVFGDFDSMRQTNPLGQRMTAKAVWELKFAAQVTL